MWVCSRQSPTPVKSVKIFCTQSFNDALRVCVCVSTVSNVRSFSPLPSSLYACYSQTIEICFRTNLWRRSIVSASGINISCNQRRRKSNFSLASIEEEEARKYGRETRRKKYPKFLWPIRFSFIITFMLWMTTAMWHDGDAFTVPFLRPFFRNVFLSIFY